MQDRKENAVFLQVSCHIYVQLALPDAAGSGGLLDKGGLLDISHTWYRCGGPALSLLLGNPELFLLTCTMLTVCKNDQQSFSCDCCTLRTAAACAAHHMTWGGAHLGRRVQLQV